MGLIRKLLRPLSPFFFRFRLIFFRLIGIKRFEIVWNRGLGDIALGLYGLNLRIYEIIPDAQIHYFTRSDLKEGFTLLANCNVTVDVAMKRGQKVVWSQNKPPNTVRIFKPNPTDWLKDQLKKVVPKLKIELPSIVLDKSEVALHVDSETGQYYGYEKNWPIEKFKILIEKLNEKGVIPVLIGLKKTEDFSHLKVKDLRGELGLIELMQYLLGFVKVIVAPDSGILSILYYLDVAIPIKVVSFWSDPHQGILKQGVKSPNPYLDHFALVQKDLRQLEPKRLLDAILC